MSMPTKLLYAFFGSVIGVRVAGGFLISSNPIHFITGIWGLVLLLCFYLWIFYED